MNPADYIDKIVKYTSATSGKTHHFLVVRTDENGFLFSVKSENHKKFYLDVEVVKELPENTTAVSKKNSDAESSDKISRERHIATSYVNKINSSKERKILFDLTLENWISLQNKKCSEYTGKLFDEDKNTLSIERKDPKQGYTVKNTIVCTLKENQVKSQLDAFIHSDVFSAKDKIRILNAQIYQLKKGLKNDELEVKHD